MGRRALGVKEKTMRSENCGRDRGAWVDLGLRVLKGLVDVHVSAKVGSSRRELESNADEESCDEPERGEGVV